METFTRIKKNIIAEFQVRNPDVEEILRKYDKLLNTLYVFVKNDLPVREIYQEVRRKINLRRVNLLPPE